MKKQSFFASLALFVFLSIASAQTLKTNGIVLRANAWNDIQVQSETGDILFTLTGFNVKWTPDLRTTGGEVKLVAADVGPGALEVEYVMSEIADSPPVRVSARFTPGTNCVDAHYEISGLPEKHNINGCMFGRRLPKGASDCKPVKLGRWKRHEYGGQPVEVREGLLLPFDLNGRKICLAFPPENKIQPNWRDARAQHTGVVKQANGVYSTDFSILVTPSDWSPETIASVWKKRPVGLAIGTDKPYNWWTSSPESESRLALKTFVVNTSDESRAVQVSHWIRDFGGHIVSTGSQSVTLRAGEGRNEEITFSPSPESSDRSRDIFFAEVRVVDAQSGAEVFARTNLSLLPPFSFQSSSENSLFGVASYWPFPSENDIRRVLERMGVRWNRHMGAKAHVHEKITSLYHNHIPWKKIGDDERDKRDAWIREVLQRCIDQGYPAWEFGNEINYSVMSIGMGDVHKGKIRSERIARYIGWLKDIRRIQAEMGPKAEAIDILTFGIAGMDVNFVREFQAAGGWDLIDGIALHPGRGNFTADYPVTKPWETWVHSPDHNYWNYYGAVRTARELIKEFGGEKSLWLTEVYSPAYPNSFWEDSLRNGAENLVLSMALAKAEGVEAVMWYQLFDSVWYDKLGINPKNREYYFGIIQRDLSFKPALLSYCAIAEQLDLATVNRWLKFPEDSKNRGLLFDTPRGPLALLWNRSDGYVLTKKTKNFASPEPWVDTWKTKVPVVFPTTGEKVTVINCIGQSEEIAAENGTLTLVLDGAPRMVYGLDAAKIGTMP